MGLAEQINDVLLKHYTELDNVGEVNIAPSVLAEAAIEHLDPERISPDRVRYAATMYLRQAARQICARRNDEDERIIEQMEMFDIHLQHRYPALRNGEEVYVLREQLTVDDRMENIARLRKEGRSKIAHAEALEAETNALIALGRLSLAGVSA